MRVVRKTARWLPVWALVGLLAMGCGARREYAVSTLSVERLAWDSVRVGVDFVTQTAIGGLRPALPDHRQLYVFDADFDTLYAGHDTLIALPDADLGDRERLMVEVCGTFGALEVCEQRALSASPKRVRAEQEIAFPEDDAFTRGSYQLRFVVERLRFAGDPADPAIADTTTADTTDAWEPIVRELALSGYLLAFVDSTREMAVKVPFARARGRFDLTRGENYRDFKYALQTRMLDQEEALVQFEVYTGLTGPATPLALVEKRVFRKTEEERFAEVGGFVEQAGRGVVTTLGGRGEHRMYVFLNDWNYDPATRTYVIEMEVHWREGRILRDWHELVGELTVRDDGSAPRFRRLRANDEAEERWRQRVEGVALSLAPLAPVAPSRRSPPDDKRRRGW